jgi:cytochrome c-type biogenesis protein CcmI
MEWGLMVGVTLVAAGVVLFVMLPVLRGDWATLERSEDEVTEADARKQAALRGLRDAEYDYRSGKIDQTDYQVLKTDLSRQALQAMEDEMSDADALVGDPPGKPAAKPGKARKKSAPDRAQELLEAEIALVRKGLADGRTCATCGHLNVEESRFCTNCGGELGRWAGPSPEPASVR